MSITKYYSYITEDSVKNPKRPYMLRTVSNKSISFKILKMKEKIDEFLDIIYQNWTMRTKNAGIEYRK